MKRLYFAFMWAGAYKIVYAGVIREGRNFWHVSPTGQEKIFGGYAFIVSEAPKKDYHGFYNLNDAVAWIRKDALDNVAEYARIICTLTQDFKRLNKNLDELTGAKK